MKLLVALAICFSVTHALTFLTGVPNVQSVHSPKWGRSWMDPSLYNQNFTLLLDPTGFLCAGQTITTSVLTRTPTFVMGIYSRCQGAVNAAVNNWRDSGAAGLIIAAPAFCADTYASLFFYNPTLNAPLATAFGGEPFGNGYNTDFPVLMFRYTEHENQYAVSFGGVAPNGTTGSWEYWQVPYGALKKGANITFNLGVPSWNSFSYSYDQVPSYIGGVVFTGQVVWALIACLASWKLGQFVMLEGKLNPFSLAQGTFLLVMYCAFWEWIQFHYGPWGSRLYMDHRFGIMVVTWGLPAMLSACLILAFYLAEISHMTSAGGDIGLHKFKIPAIIVCALMFVIDFIASSLAAARIPSVDVIQLFRAWAALELACGVFAGIVVIWGAVQLALLAGSVSGERRSIIFRSLIFVIVLLVFLLLGAGFFWGILLYSASYGNNITQATWMLSWILYPGGTCLCLLLLYRPSVSKEVELSKSATSATSGTSSSGRSGSSSSSSAADPVIEL